MGSSSSSTSEGVIGAQARLRRIRQPPEKSLTGRAAAFSPKPSPCSRRSDRRSARSRRFPRAGRGVPPRQTDRRFPGAALVPGVASTLSPRQTYSPAGMPEACTSWAIWAMRSLDMPSISRYRYQFPSSRKTGWIFRCRWRRSGPGAGRAGWSRWRPEAAACCPGADLCRVK